MPTPYARTRQRLLPPWVHEIKLPAPIPVTSCDLDTLARTLYGECRNQPEEGQIAVAWVIRNRVENPGWWTTYQPSEQRSTATDTHIGLVAAACIRKFQFSCWLKGDPNLIKLLGLSVEDPDYIKLKEIGRRVMAGEIEDPSNGADHYANLSACRPQWADTKTPSCVISDHTFWKLGRY